MAEEKDKKEKKKGAEASPTSESNSRHLSSIGAFTLHLACGFGLATAWAVARFVESVELVSDPSRTLRLIWVLECPIVILLYSLFREKPQQISYFRAVGRGALALPAGALINGLGAIAIGAPVGTKYLAETVNWSLMMSTLDFVPAASVFGASWRDWQRIFAYTKPNRPIDVVICLPAHGAIIGAWFGAWPMPLDWERPWQEWPICVSYGALMGYLVGMVASLGCILLRHRQHHIKAD